ncbi:MYB DNA-binding domain protein [Aspergillus foveolatus]|uniref:MYB DNA-binding domain protein n=1 Tax=Aspergillus foveolatus TaxID=210207 RepID=UPI003CCCAC59
MGQGSSQPAGLAQSGESDDDSSTQALVQNYSSPPKIVKRSKAESHQGSSKRRRKSSQSGTRPSTTSPGALPASVEEPGPESPQEDKSATGNEPRSPSGSTGTNHLAPTTRVEEPQQENETAFKRKRKSIEGNSSPLRASPDPQPSAVKRKRLIDSFSNNDASVATRKNRPRPGHRSNDSQSHDSSMRLPKSTPSSAIKSDYKVSPSPALSVGGSQTKGRLKRSNGTVNAKGTTGAFLPHEVEALEDFKVEFCNANACSTTVFDLMVQHGKEGPFPGPSGIGKRAFWQQVHKILPGRDRRSVYRFMKRHFQASGQKPHEWTEEQEDELVVLYQQHGPKWAHIAEMLGRSGDDVVQRWKNRLEHRDTMRTGPWSDEETNQLKDALRAAWDKLRSEGINVGENIYEMDESLILWSQISKSMRHVRSRQQCADKWRRLKLTAAGSSQANSRANSRVNSRSVTPHSAKPEPHKNYKSAAYVFSSEDESESDSKPKEKTKTSSHLKTSTLDHGFKGYASREASEAASSDKSSATSSSEEESDSEEVDSSDVPSVSKQKRAESPSRRSGTPDDKRLKLKRESSPTPSAVASHESSSESESESENDSADEPSRSSSSEPDSGSEADSDVNKEIAVKSSPNKLKAQKRAAIRKSSSPADHTGSDSSATDSSESSDSEDETQAKRPITRDETERVDNTPNFETGARGVSEGSETRDSSSEESGSGSESESSSDSE